MTVSQNQCLNVHFMCIFEDLFLIPFLVTQGTATEALTIAAILFYPREGTQELTESCKVNEVS